MLPHRCDVAVIGGGIVGTATALRLLERSRVDLVLLEAESHVGAHQTGHNSGVIHSGLYYKPGSLKARLCAEGREALYRFCEQRGVRHERCGKVIVAVRPGEIAYLDELERRGHANGIQGLRRLSPVDIREIEPHAAGVDGLFVPDTGIVDFGEVADAYAVRINDLGGIVATGALVRAVSPRKDLHLLETEKGALLARYLVNCAGLQSDRVARMCGRDPGLRIVPFRGEYWTLAEEKRHLVRNLIYPVPDPQFPFLGVHFTRRIGGEAEAGPNAILAFRRDGYRRFSFSLRDTLDVLTYRGSWKVFRKHWRTGLDEWHRSLSRSALLRALRTLVPELEGADLRPGGTGVRAQAVDPSGALVDDFRFVEGERMIHVLNAPSPAATASLAIGSEIAAMAVQRFGLHV